MKKLALFLSLFVITACNSNNNNPDPGKFSCLGVVYIPYHRIDIETEEVLPDKIAIEIEGEIKYDECLEQAVIPPPPIVHGERRKIGLAVVVQHFGAYKELPEDISFRVFDRKDCSAAEELFFEASNVPLEFEKVYPAGVECGSNTFAKATVVK